MDIRGGVCTGWWGGVGGLVDIWALCVCLCGLLEMDIRVKRLVKLVGESG